MACIFYACVNILQYLFSADRDTFVLYLDSTMLGFCHRFLSFFMYKEMFLPSCILDNPVFQTGHCRSRCSSETPLFWYMPRFMTWYWITYLQGYFENWITYLQGSLENQRSLVETIKKVHVVIASVKGSQLTDELNVI